MRFIFLHGKPACGKDFQANKISLNLPKSRVVSGIYRSAIESRGEFSRFHDDIVPFVLPLGDGIRVPGELVVRMLKHVVEKGRCEGIESFIFCGIPRKDEHFKDISSWVKKLQSEQPLMVDNIYFEISDQIALERSGNRKNIDKEENKDRKDDESSLFVKRVERFNSNVAPVLNQLWIEGQVVKIDASRDRNAVYEDTVKVLGISTGIETSHPSLLKENRHF